MKFATDSGFPNPTFFIDDGVSGVTFDRPGWNEMIRLAEAGKVKTVIVKDMSRMGRDYLKVGYYTESFFAERDIRYIAINDGVDSDKGDNDFTPFRNLFNDFYARDTSKKIRAVMRAKGNAGEHLCTNPPYGYMKDPSDKRKWIVDEEAAEIVKRIFDLCIAGKGPMQIAKLLTAEYVLTVKAHYAQRDGKPLPEKPYQWSPKSVAGILERPEYTGCTVNFKTYSKSHKLKKQLHNASENQRIFPNTQPAIIDEQVFARVQELRENKRRPSKTGKQGLFSGLLYCADCGDKLYFCTTNSFSPRQDLLTQNQDHRMPHSVLPLLGKLRTVFLEHGERYEECADVAVSAGFTSGLDLTEAKHAIVYEHSPYLDAFGTNKNPLPIRERYPDTNVEGSEQTAWLGDRYLVFPDIGSLTEDHHYETFAEWTGRALIRWGLMSGESGLSGAGRIVSDTGELAFDPQKGTFTVRTELCEIFSGRTGGRVREINLGGRFCLHMSNEKMTVSLLALDDRTLKESGHMLLAAVGSSGMDETVYDEQEDGYTAVKLRGKLYLDTLEGTLRQLRGGKGKSIYGPWMLMETV